MPAHQGWLVVFIYTETQNDLYKDFKYPLDFNFLIECDVAQSFIWLNQILLNYGKEDSESIRIPEKICKELVRIYWI